MTISSFVRSLRTVLEDVLEGLDKTTPRETNCRFLFPSLCSSSHFCDVISTEVADCARVGGVPDVGSTKVAVEDCSWRALFGDDDDVGSTKVAVC